MGLVTWIAIAVIVLVVIGLGVGAFFSGLLRGAQIVGHNPTVQNATQEAKQFIENKTSNSNIILVTTNKASYNKGEPVVITVKNTGSETLSFPDSSLGLQIQNVNTGDKYSVISAQVITQLGEGQSKVITWNQEDGVKLGDYVATVHTTPPEHSISAQVGFQIK